MRMSALQMRESAPIEAPAVESGLLAELMKPSSFPDAPVQQVSARACRASDGRDARGFAARSYGRLACVCAAGKIACYRETHTAVTGAGGATAGHCERRTLASTANATAYYREPSTVTGAGGTTAGHCERRTFTSAFSATAYHCQCPTFTDVGYA